VQLKGSREEVRIGVWSHRPNKNGSSQKYRILKTIFSRLTTAAIGSVTMTTEVGTHKDIVSCEFIWIRRTCNHI